MMGREVIVSSGDALRVISTGDGCEMMRVPLERAGALCAAKENVFCACGDAVWKLHRKTLAPAGLYIGGPDMCSLLLSEDGARLYALSAEGDSVLMMDAQTGEPMILHAAGVNPREMMRDGDTLAVAGGESGMVFLFCAKTLQLLQAVSMPGPVYSVQIDRGQIYALCMTAALSSTLVTCGGSGVQYSLALAGMPGRLLIDKAYLLAATDGCLYMVSRDGGRILKKRAVPGRAVWLANAGEEILMLDGYAEKLYAVRRQGIRTICAQARFAERPGE